MVISIINVLCE